MAHVDAAAFVDAGNVAPRVGDLNLEKRSYGAGLRIHNRKQTFGRVDIARGGEGWRFVVRLTDPGMTVIDAEGREWTVKQPYPSRLDDEGPVEVVLS